MEMRRVARLVLLQLIISLGAARRREKDLMEVHPTESNSGAAIIPNVQPFHPLAVVANNKGELWPIRSYEFGYFRDFLP